MQKLSFVAIVFFLAFIPPWVNAQSLDLTYEFSDSLDDSDAAHPGTNYVFTDRGTIINDLGSYRDYVNDSPVYDTDGETGYLYLEPEDYIGFNPGILASLDLDQPLKIGLRFRFQPDDPLVNTSPCCADDIFRQLLTTTDGHQTQLGFSLQVVREDIDNWYLVLFVGDGRGQLTQGFEVGSEGYRYKLMRIYPGQWHSISLIFRLNESGKERITGFADGSPFTAYLTEADKLKPLAVKRHLEGVVVGRSPDDTYADICAEYECTNQNLGIEESLGVDAPSLFLGAYPAMDPHNAQIALSIDRLVIQSPPEGTDTGSLQTLLDGFTNNETGESVQDETVLQQWLIDFTSTFSGEWGDLKTGILAFLDAFAAARDPLFLGDYLRSPGDFDAAQRLAYFLEQWILDNRFQDTFDAADAGISFEDSEVFPGPVNSEAPRVSATVGIDASYQTDPGFVLNGQETVLRPTGYYAAPGEAVTITVPDSMVGKGLSIRVGIQRADMEGGGWIEFNRFPRISSLYDIEAASVMVANPFGGGIYVEIPDGTDLGVVTVDIDGAVKMPMYSTLDLPGHSDNLSQFNADVDAWNVPWFEMHGRNFSTTLPMNEAKLYPDPGALLTLMDDSFDAISKMAGRPLQRPRAEWLAYDRFVTYNGTALAASYPIFPNKDIDERGVFWDKAPTWGSPAVLLSPDFFAPDDPADTLDSFDERQSNYILFHEWGHLHNLPTLQWQESESNVHLLASVLYNEVLGADIDTALQWSGFQHFNRDQAAMDTTLSPNWQEGKRLTEATFNGQWDNEVRYQTRSWARLVEIAAMYGWKAVGAIHKVFYDRGVSQGYPVEYGIEDDDFIESASAALNLNLSPLFDFWGVPPSAETADRLKQYPVPAAFEPRLQHYLTLVPADNIEFQALYDSLAPTNSGAVGARLDYYRENYNEDTAAVIIGRIDGILATYYPDGPGDGVWDGLTVRPPEEPIPEAVKVNTLGTDARSAEFRLGAYADNGTPSYGSDFAAGDFVTLYGQVTPDPVDVGTDGELYAALLAVIDGKASFSFVDEDGNFEAWDTTLANLGPILVATPLEEVHEMRIFEGNLQAGTYKITFAYQAEGGPLVYMKPIRIVVTD